MFKTYLKGDDITIQYMDGVAILIGTVFDESHKLLAQETLASLPGVTGVYSKLEDRSEVPALNIDAWLAAKVKSTLLFHQNVNAAETEVIAKKGTIILRGKAASTAKKDLTAEYAKDVEGVKIVKNEMKTPTAAMKPGKTHMGEIIDSIGEVIDDASVTALVKSTLLYHRPTSALNTTVETKDGVVNLGGTAKNEAEKDLTTKLVSDVQGVKTVINNMTIK